MGESECERDKRGMNESFDAEPGEIEWDDAEPLALVRVLEK